LRETHIENGFVVDGHKEEGVVVLERREQAWIHEQPRAGTKMEDKGQKNRVS
jgi:hypothetical protein